VAAGDNNHVSGTWDNIWNSGGVHPPLELSVYWR
jgi:hypothetical protein